MNLLTYTVIYQSSIFPGVVSCVLVRGRVRVNRTTEKSQRNVSECDWVCGLCVCLAADYPEDPHVPAAGVLRVICQRVGVSPDSGQLHQPQCRQREGQGVSPFDFNKGRTLNDPWEDGRNKLLIGKLNKYRPYLVIYLLFFKPFIWSFG